MCHYLFHGFFDVFVFRGLLKVLGFGNLVNYPQYFLTSIAAAAYGSVLSAKRRGWV